MRGLLKAGFLHRHGRTAVIASAVMAAGVLAGGSVVAQQRGPASVADVAEQVLDAVVNISTSQTISGRQAVPTPQVPPGSPFEEFFEEFFKRRGEEDSNRPRRVSSLGSGFVIDAEGIIVTNNHVIADADEIFANFNDGTKLKAEVVGKDTKTDIAVLRVKPEKPLKAVGFGDSDKLRVGDWVMAIGNPFGLGGTLTVGVISARNRDINSGPYDNFLQTDAAINRGNSGGPLFDMDGDVIGINTAIISPSGGSIGIGFAVPSRTAMAVIDQLRTYKEVRRGWLGVKIQQVSPEIAESLGVRPPRGALVAGVDDDGPAKPAGIEAGDVVIRFDGKTVAEMRDLPRIVADTPVGKSVEVVIIRKGKEETRTVTLGRLDDGAKPKPASATTEPGANESQDKPVVQKTLGLSISGLTEALRKEYGIRESIRGVVVTGVEPGSVADQRLTPGNVIVTVEQQQVTTPEELQERVEQLRKAGKKTALLLVSDGKGDVQFIALSLE